MQFLHAAEAHFDVITMFRWFYSNSPAESLAIGTMKMHVLNKRVAWRRSTDVEN